MTALLTFLQNMIRQSIYPKRYNLSIVREDGSVDFLAWSHLGMSFYHPLQCTHLEGTTHTI